MNVVADRLRPFALSLWLAGALLVAQPVAAQPEWRYQDVERVVAVADIHGAYDAFERILHRTSVIDETLRWSAGATHLVIVGDVVDRGPDSRRALDLIRKLETEAAAAGGAVHLVLGNHEVMNMTGDLRYVSPEEYAAFAADETDAMRDRAFELYRVDQVPGEDETGLRNAFDQAYPPGFFAHREAFSIRGEYGAWLAEKPFLLVVDDFAFVHGGLISAMIEDGASFNARLNRELKEILLAYEGFIDRGLISRSVDLYELPDMLPRILTGLEVADQSAEDELLSQAGTLAAFGDSLLFSADGPIWYRGNVGCSRLTEQDRLVDALEAAGAQHLAVGHTPAESALVLSRMNEALLRIDTGMLNDYYGGRASALIIEGESISVMYEDEQGVSVPLEQPRRVGVLPPGLDEAAVEQALRSATTGSSNPVSEGALYALYTDDLGLQGLFMPAEKSDVNTAVAAYRLDRLLGLDMVPVTVAREIDGEAGALQYWPTSSISETERVEENLGAGAWCPLGDQFGDMYLFDSLIYNEARSAESIRYSSDNFQLLLVGNYFSFSTSRGRPGYLAGQPVVLTDAWRRALESLDEQALTEALGDVLDRRRIRALLERRDWLLERAE